MRKLKIIETFKVDQLTLKVDVPRPPKTKQKQQCFHRI